MAYRSTQFRPLKIDGSGEPGIASGIYAVSSYKRVPWGDAGELQAGDELFIRINGAAAVKDLPVIEAGSNNCLVIRGFIGPNAHYPDKPSSVDYVFVPAGAGTVDFEDLPKVDPKTLGPVVAPLPSEVQVVLDDLRVDVDALAAGGVVPGTVTVDSISGLTEPGKTALKVTGATLADRQAAFRSAIGAGTSSLTLGTSDTTAAAGSLVGTVVALTALVNTLQATVNTLSAQVASKADLNSSGFVDASDIDPAIARQTDVDDAVANMVAPEWSTIRNRPGVMIPWFNPGDQSVPRVQSFAGPNDQVVWYQASEPSIDGTNALQYRDLYRPWDG